MPLPITESLAPAALGLAVVLPLVAFVRAALLVVPADRVTIVLRRDRLLPLGPGWHLLVPFLDVVVETVEHRPGTVIGGRRSRR